MQAFTGLRGNFPCNLKGANMAEKIQWKNGRPMVGEYVAWLALVLSYPNLKV